jgi:uncharacterized protein
MNFIGRKTELEELSKLFKKDNSITVIYGRRRVGKSLLIREFLKNSPALFFEGQEGLSKQQQLKNFTLQLNHQTKENFSTKRTWTEAFLQLEQVVKEKPTWIVLDEFQWMANYRSEIVSELKMVWDQYLAQIPNVSLILCGSIASFMTSKVVKSKSLYGRTDKIIHLQEFTLAESKLMLPNYGPQELMEAHMIFGGIPRYLELIKDYPSLYIAINDLAFRKNGYFVDEFDRIFVSHFARNEDYSKIITILSQYPYGLYRKDLAEKTAIELGGGLSEHLFNLESAGFIRSFRPLDKKSNSRITKYYLSDAFLRFYFTFILPNKNQIAGGPSLKFSVLAQQSTYQSWRGKAFENLCTQHALTIAHHLGFSDVNYRFGPYFRASSKNMPGVQIDLLFERDDHVITLCEMKSGRYLNTSVINEVDQKRERLKLVYPRHTILPVLIYDGSLPDSIRHSSTFHKTLEAETVLLN